MTTDHTATLDAVLTDHDGRITALESRLSAVEALLKPVEPQRPLPPAKESLPYTPPTWVEKLRYDWRDATPGRFTQSRMHGLIAMQSGKLVNDGIRPEDSSNAQLQKPTRYDAVEVVADVDASHGKALALWSRPGVYETSTGQKTGIVNARIQTEKAWSLPMAVSMRARRWSPDGQDAVNEQDKSTAMWWPTGGGWPWEADFDEHMNRMRGTSMRHHVDVDGDGAAKEQVIENLPLINIFEYHWYTFVAYEDRNEYYVDDQLVLSVTDPKWVIGKTEGHTKEGVFAYGRAAANPRSSHTASIASVIDEITVFAPIG